LPARPSSVYSAAMRTIVAAGYAFTALLYAWAWLAPSGKTSRGLIEWVSFSRLPLAEFLSLHAATLLGAFLLVNETERGRDEPLGMIFWALLAFYALLAVGAYLFHRSHRVLLGFYLTLGLRGAQFFSLGAPEPDVMRSEVLKNFLMSVPMMLLVAGISMSDDLLTPWQEGFQRPGASLRQRLWRGKPLLFVTAYYLLWAFVESKWPLRIAK
jgi:hypothetical protein